MPVRADDDDAKPAAAPASPASAAPKKNPFERATDPLAGLFTNDEFQIQIEVKVAADGGCTGTFRVQGQTYPFKASRKENSFAGTYVADGVENRFDATLTGDTLSFTSGTAKLELQRQKQAPPTQPTTPTPAAPTDPTAAQPALNLGQLLGRPPVVDAGVALAVPAAKDWAFTATATGLRFRYPRSWQVIDGRPGLALVPDPVERDLNGQPLEHVLISVPEVNADATSDAQKVVHPLTLIQQRFPFAKPVGEPTPLLSLTGTARVLTYEGAVSDGSILRISLYENRIDDQRSRYLIHLGRKDLVERRQGVARQVFQSFGWEDGRTDAGLRGDWKTRGGAVVAGRSDTSKAGGSQWQLSFAADGTCRRTPLPAEANAAGRNGAWVAMNGRLAVTWSDGSLDLFAYRVDKGPNGGSMLTLEAPGAPPVVLTK